MIASHWYCFGAYQWVTLQSVPQGFFILQEEKKKVESFDVQVPPLSIPILCVSEHEC